MNLTQDSARSIRLDQAGMQAILAEYRLHLSTLWGLHPLFRIPVEGYGARSPFPVEGYGACSPIFKFREGMC